MLNPDFAEMLVALSAEGVEYLLVGAYAMAAHGVPRATGDIDIWVRPTPENAERVLRAPGRFGAPLFDLTAADLARKGTVFQLRVPPRRIDILTSIDGVTFAVTCFPRHSGPCRGRIVAPPPQTSWPPERIPASRGRPLESPAPPASPASVPARSTAS